MDHDETLDQMRERFAADQARWDRRMRRNQTIARWFLIPYALAGALAGWQIGVAATYSLRLGLLLAVAVTVIVFSQWTQPYLTRRGDRKDSISAPDAENVGTVEEVRDTASE